MPESVRPPLPVRLAFHLHLPLDREWHPRAIAKIEAKYGPDPSHDERGFRLWTPAGTQHFGMPDVQRKSWALVSAVGRNSEGQLVQRTRVERWLVRASPSVRLLYPVALVLGFALLITATALLGLAID